MVSEQGQGNVFLVQSDVPKLPIKTKWGFNVSSVCVSVKVYFCYIVLSKIEIFTMRMSVFCVLLSIFQVEVNESIDKINSFVIIVMKNQQQLNVWMNQFEFHWKEKGKEINFQFIAFVVEPNQKKNE